MALDLSAMGVSKILDGSASDALDELEASSFLETQLRCELLRAQIESVTHNDRVNAHVLQRSIQHVDVVLGFTLIALVGSAFVPSSLHSGLIAAVITTLAIVSAGAARAGRRMQ